jgi:nucleoside-diphosphate-sugar epimerase
MPDGIFITGGTGNTGQALLGLIAADEALRGIRITGLCRPGGRGERLLPHGVKIAGGDASSAASLGKVYRGEPVVIHLSSIFHAKAVLEGCRGMKRLIAVSSTRIFSKTWERAPEIEAAERAIESSDVPYTILRPTMIYGNSEDRNISKFIRLVGKYGIVPLPGGGKSVFQPVHVEDLAGCILAAIKTPESAGKSYNVPGGSAHSLREIVEIISGILKKRVLIVPFPLALAEAAAGLQEKLFPRPFIRREQIERLREDKRYDFSEAANDLGYAPRSFAEGVAEEIRLIRSAETVR